MAECWSCGAERGRARFCTSCSKIQPVDPKASSFELLGLPPAMRLDRDALDKAFREISRQVHPDGFGPGRAETGGAGSAGGAERKLALEHTMAVNEAYRALKTPRTRAERLMRARGIVIGQEQDRVDDPEFLMDMLELREQLEHARGAAVEPLAREVRARKDAALETLTRFFDDGVGSEGQSVRALERLRFYERFLDEVDTKLDA